MRLYRRICNELISVMLTAFGLVRGRELGTVEQLMVTPVSKGALMLGKVLPYLGLGEFYLEYGNFDVNITLPASCIVVASGELMNPREVLTPVEYERWKQARNSEHKVYICNRQDINNPRFKLPKDQLTWEFSTCKSIRKGFTLM